ncbi:choloylglycine hydrolase family protein [Enterococcus faecalis]|nr:choloylglycine hydrolase family protein [Enterococcus faecalis]
MCTSLTMTTKDNVNLLARTMDFSFELGGTPVFIPRNHTFKSDVGEGSDYKSSYAFVGAGRKLAEYLFADGVNEKGIGICALYFSGLSQYSDKEDTMKLNIAPHEFVTWVLGSIDSLDSLKTELNNLNIMNVKNSFLNVVTPLHWIVADSSGDSLIIEMTASGTHIYDNEASVFTNNPEYPWHLTNLNHYSFLSNVTSPTMSFGKHVSISDGMGSGAMGLPGDFTSESRFIRAAFLKANIYQPENAVEAINTLAHILNSVDIPKGDKKAKNGDIDYTQYKGFMDLSNKTYTMMPYENTCPVQVKLTDELIKSKSPFVFKMDSNQEIINLASQL